MLVSCKDVFFVVSQFSRGGQIYGRTVATRKLSLHMTGTLGRKHPVGIVLDSIGISTQ